MFRVSFQILVSLVIIRIALSISVPQVSARPDDTAEETQHAICRIITQEIQTSANATVKRQLKGVCTSKLLEYKFKQLEKKLFRELDHIKTLLTSDRAVTVKTNNDYDYFPYDEKSGGHEGNIISVTETITQERSWSRTEISKLNNTIYTIKGEQVYTYYWEIPRIRSVLRKSGMHLRSPDLIVLGHQLCIQLYPSHLDSNYLGLQLRPSSNFWKKHRFIILDQFDSSKDIKSQIVGGVGSYETIYRVPYEKLEERKYLYNDTIIIKLTIYLNS